eukprot:gene3225-3703_t
MATTTSQSAPSSVSLQQLPLQQLEHLKSQIEDELKMLTESISRLKGAQQKFTDSMENLSMIDSKQEGKEVLIPMTSSMYVPGLLKDLKTVNVEIGTGYYAEKSVKDAKDYFKRKIEFIGKQVERIHPILAEKQSIGQAIVETMNAKIQQQMNSTKVTEKIGAMKT